MITIERVSDFSKLSDGNAVLGTIPVLNNSKIRFSGKNNILYCESGVRLSNSFLDFNGSNSLIYLGSNRHDYLLHVFINNDQVFHMGKDNYINGKLTAVLSEQKHVFIGSCCLFSTEIVFRNADPHLIYDIDTKKRINLSKSIFVGDHVWIGQRSMLLKGTQIDSGSIIGAMSVVSGKKIPHNSSWAGNPVRQIKSGVFWDGDCVHTWMQNHTDISMNWDDYKDNKKKVNDWIYHYDIDHSISFDDLDSQISECRNSQDKLKFFLNLKDTFDQFAHMQ
ncbi:MAG: hypothetical protein IJK59_10310 [Firmicutes bacterium]|nr:hypothetical protein [Bacillota bacterium]